MSYNLGMSKYIQIITTTNDEVVAKRIGRTLVEKRLAACVQIIRGITSIYWWEGKITEDSEILIFIKSKEELYKEIEKTIKELHNYSVPEILSIPISDGNPDYFKWMENELQNNGNE